MLQNILYLATIWALPLIIAITFHEAAHGYAAHLLGDDTAFWLGRASFNPLKHIDPFGTLILPAMLLLMHSPFLFGYAKPVPVSFRALKNPRRGMALIAAAGPAMNLALAILAALAFHAAGYFPSLASQWLMDNLWNALLVNVVLAVFNLFPIPPLDGGRILAWLLPRGLANALDGLEPYGFAIVIGLFIILPLLGPELGLHLNAASHMLTASVDATINGILSLTGNG